MSRSHTLLAGVVLSALLIGAAAGPAGATQTDDAPDPSLTVALAADGDARVTLVSTFDLAEESEAAAFDELRTNETARAAYEARYTDRWRAVADSTANRTGREMTVTNASLSLSRTNATGVATYTISWAGLATAEDRVLTLDEPFASNYTTDRQFRVRIPEGYTYESASPGPANATDGVLVYRSGTDLNGLSIVATSTASGVDGTPVQSETPTPVGTTGGSGPGFGVVAAVGALTAAALLTRRHE